MSAASPTRTAAAARSEVEPVAGREVDALVRGEIEALPFLIGKDRDALVRIAEVHRVRLEARRREAKAVLARWDREEGL